MYAFTRPGNAAAQRLALDLKACWAGGSDELPPDELDAALIFAERQKQELPDGAPRTG